MIQNYINWEKTDRLVERTTWHFRSQSCLDIIYQGYFSRIVSLSLFYNLRFQRQLNIMSRDFKIFLGVAGFLVLLKGYILYIINPAMYLNPIINQSLVNLPLLQKIQKYIKYGCYFIIFLLLIFIWIRFSYVIHFQKKYKVPRINKTQQRVSILTTL